MRSVVRGFTLRLAFVLILVSACGNGDEARGGLDEPCHPSNTCDDPYVCEDGLCVVVEPDCPVDKDCTGRECGPDPVCEESCGTCPSGQSCDDSGQCYAWSCGDDCGEMVTVPGGPFMMGCNEAVDTECLDTQHPYHEVNVPSFEIDKYPVTVALYRECMDAVAGCLEPTVHSSCNWQHPDRDDHPVNCLRWHQARRYCEWAGKRLCSEAEWEKAARGTDGRKYSWGNEPVSCEYAVFNEGGEPADRGCGEGGTWPVGSKPLGVSPYGALDMSGNVREWVEDDWHSSYEDAPTDGSAWVDEPRAHFRVLRGGGFWSTARGVRASARSNMNPDDGSYSYLGARCCR